MSEFAEELRMIESVMPEIRAAIQRQIDYTRAALGYDNRGPSDRPYPCGQAELEFSAHFRCELDGSGSVRILSMNGVPVPDEVKRWLVSSFGDTFRSELVLELEKEEPDA